MTSYKTTIDNIYAVKESEIILGLTGRTGAGCSTVAKILSTQNYNDLDLSFPESRKELNSDTDKIKFDIIDHFMNKGKKWSPFTSIEGSSIILSYILSQPGDKNNASSALTDYLDILQKNTEGKNLTIIDYEKLKKDIEGTNHIFEEYQEKPLDILSEKIDDFDIGNNDYRNLINDYYSLYVVNLPKRKKRLKEILDNYDCYVETKQKIQDERPIKFHFYTYLFQKIGNNIRSSGEPYKDTFDEKFSYGFSKCMELFIKLIRAYNKINNISHTRICIDAIRNPYESVYLKDCFRSYYLLSISTDEYIRKNRLTKMMDQQSQSGLDSIEYPNKLKLNELFFHQNIGGCFEMADIHILNNDNNEDTHNKFLKWQLVKYIALMIHPGLITPTHIERCMQLAYNAKYNSGCLSRLVGAVITDSDFAIKAVGWNDVAKGQIPCNLRDILECQKTTRPDCYSEYEKTNPEFNEAIKNLNQAIDYSNLTGRYFPYCFKDIYNSYTDQRNQVYTRSLHAEENAFLQISKYGGQGIKDGYLFCTASPCELCSKKAYQLGITKIFYIDPYPGISKTHILKFGKSNHNPEMNLFYGAIGEAYISLYRPIMAYKDELELYSGINVKQISKDGFQKNIDPDSMDLSYEYINCSLEFVTREKIESTRDVKFEIKNGSFRKLNRKITWTGSSYDFSELIEPTSFNLCDSKDTVSPFRYSIDFGEEKTVGNNVAYKIKTYVKDETKVMHPYFSNMIYNPTAHLTLSVIVPNNSNIIKNVHIVRYADMEMKTRYDGTEKIKKIKKDDKTIYSLNVPNPNLFYTYSIEWDFEQ